MWFDKNVLVSEKYDEVCRGYGASLSATSQTVPKKMNDNGYVINVMGEERRYNMCTLIAGKSGCGEFFVLQLKLLCKSEIISK